MRFSAEENQSSKNKNGGAGSMERKEELQKITKKLDPEVLKLMNPLIDNLIFLEDQLDYLKKLPFIVVSEKDPARQKTTPAYKQYKDLSQTYINSLKVINGALGIEESDGTSPLREYMNMKKKKMECR